MLKLCVVVNMQFNSVGFYIFCVQDLKLLFFTTSVVIFLTSAKHVRYQNE